MTRPKLLWHSNSAWAPTGYGAQTALFAPRINETYEVGISSFYGLEGARLNWQDMTVYPGLGGDFGNASLPAHAAAHFGGNPRGGLVLTLMDVWVLDPRIARSFNTCCWVPVDHEPATPAVTQFFEHSGAIPIAMSKFGAKMLSAYDPLYVPHGVDTKVYRPIPKDEAKAFTEFPDDKFIVGMVAANKGNPSRKCFAEALTAFKAFHAAHPSSMLYLHTEMTGRFDGVNLAHLIEGLGLPDGSVFFPDQDRLLFHPFSHSAMANVYSSLDVLLSPSAGEGFGLCVLEAAACGVPAIVTDFSAQKEVCGAGWKVDYQLVWTPQESWQAIPDVKDILEALKEAHRQDDRQREAMSTQARKHAEGYDADLVTSKYFIPALESVAERYAERQPTPLKMAA